MRLYLERYLLSITLMAAPLVTVYAAPLSTLQLTLQGKECRVVKNQTFVCDYNVGKDLKFRLEGIGLQGAGISFLRSSAAGDFFAMYGLGHGCVVVKRGKKGITTKRGPGSSADAAFVSPKSGKVYTKWKQCQRNM